MRRAVAKRGNKNTAVRRGFRMKCSEERAGAERSRVSYKNNSMPLHRVVGRSVVADAEPFHVQVLNGRFKRKIINHYWNFFLNAIAEPPSQKETSPWSGGDRSFRLSTSSSGASSPPSSMIPSSYSHSSTFASPLLFCHHPAAPQLQCSALH